MAKALQHSPVDLLSRHATKTRAGRIVQVLCAAYPEHIPAKQLMIRAGIDFHGNPVTAFIELCISFSQINQALPEHGWQADRSGGGPDDNYWLSHHGG